MDLVAAWLWMRCFVTSGMTGGESLVVRELQMSAYAKIYGELLRHLNDRF